MESVVKLFKRIQHAIDKGNVSYAITLKPKQVQCFESLLNGDDVLAVLPTGFGKSLIYQLLPYLLPTKTEKNIVIVVSPLNSIIEDQMKVLEYRGISTAMLQCEVKPGHTVEQLFIESEKLVADVKIPDQITNADLDILFSHPEALLSSRGRKLLKSDVYQTSVVACVIDEAHCMEMWGEEFRIAYKELASLKAFFPSSVTLALTATAAKSSIKQIMQDLCMKSPQIVTASPNRRNVFLCVKKRMASCYGIDSYENILRPIAEELNILRETYPMTIIYMGLKYCGYAFQLFSMIIESHFVGPKYNAASRLFTQFHAPTINREKEQILGEIKKPNSKIRVIFATAALGMGVNAPNITNVIHIGPPGNLESYVQEIGRAGRNGMPSFATLYFNNSDIGVNREKIHESMKRYCVETGCLRKYLLNYFGFFNEVQLVCCSNCTSAEEKSDQMNKQRNVRPFAEDININDLKKELEILASASEGQDYNFYYPCSLTSEVIGKIISNVHLISNEKDLLNDFGIWEEDLSSAMMVLIQAFAPKYNIK